MRGQIRQRNPMDKDSWTIIVSMGRHPKTGKYAQHWESFKGNKTAADKRLRELLTQLDTGMVMRPGKVTVAEFFRRWLLDYAKGSVRPRTFEGYRQKIEHNVIPALGQIPLAKLQPGHLLAFYQQLSENGRADGKGGLSSQTVCIIHRIVSEGLSHAMRWGLVVRNVAQAVDPPRVSRKEMRALDGGELAMFLSVAKDTEYRTLFELDAYTGLRRSEILGLRWKDVDLTLCSLSVNRAMHVLKDGTITFAEPKSAKSRRTVALTPKVALMLSAYRTGQVDTMKELGHNLTEDDLIFLHADGSPMLPDGITRVFKKMARQCGLTDVHMHSLRHTHASILLRQGIHPKLVQERLGHSSIALTLDTYSHVTPGLHEKAALAFDDAMTQAILVKVPAGINS